MAPKAFLIALMVAGAGLISSRWHSALADEDLLVPGSTFQVEGQVEGTDSSGSFTNTITLIPGTYSLDGGALSLTLSMVSVEDIPGEPRESLLFNYSTTSGGPFAQQNEAWSLEEVGLELKKPISFITDYVYFLINGVAQDPTSSPIVFPPLPNEFAELHCGVLCDTYNDGFVGGPLPAIGLSINPWSNLNLAGIDSSEVNGYEQRLIFIPAYVVTPEPDSLILLGFGLSLLAGFWLRKSRMSVFQAVQVVADNGAIDGRLQDAGVRLEACT